MVIKTYYICNDYINIKIYFASKVKVLVNLNVLSPSKNVRSKVISTKFPQIFVFYIHELYVSWNSFYLKYKLKKVK